jgi:hypothetical protein
MLYTSGSQPFGTHVPPNQTQTLLRTLNSGFKPPAYPQMMFVHSSCISQYHLDDIKDMIGFILTLVRNF